MRVNKLCLFVFSKLAKASSLDNGKIVAAKKDIRRRERKIRQNALTERPIEYTFREKQQESCGAFDTVFHAVLG